ncbi:hypothetical protein J2128_000319 [Methanomicrobium sp. W14]|uniref:YIP1 family protein n=1 Tax=Methanomicrobium sp. W14 TaxID=2817839 RepID=UPI001AE7EFAD|nr:YIP1 family protein [Methanomicrobium sp. W14]MBP2132398.1 hypothetical protein [Methanomicrobium sp. W14]
MHEIIKNAFYVLASPSHAIQKVRKSDYREDLLFFVFITLAGSVLYLLASLLYRYSSVGTSGNWGIAWLFVVFVVNYISFIASGIFLVLAISLIIHFFLLFTKGGAGKYNETFKGVIYSGTPVVLFLWLTKFFGAFYVLLPLLVWFGVITYISIRILKEKTNMQSTLVTLFISAVLLAIIYFNYGTGAVPVLSGA